MNNQGPRPVTALLGQQKPPLHNILIGEEIAQVRFMEGLTQRTSTFRQKVIEADFLDSAGVLLRVSSNDDIRVPYDLRQSIGIWTAAPLTANSIGIGYIIRYAASRVGCDMKRAPSHTYSVLCRLLTKNKIEDVTHAASKAWEYLLKGIPEPKAWIQPWEDEQAWYPSAEDIYRRWYRLLSLKKELTGCWLANRGFTRDANLVGFTKKMALNYGDLRIAKVVATLGELSEWYAQRSDADTCAAAISDVWAKRPIKKWSASVGFEDIGQAPVGGFRHG